ncbi:MAG: zinc-dependent metalloprotease, partial [Rhodothermaceae bacterium]|nr:zinc-dependent metalloprotease [Rhodothermaceae bacterium]
SEDLGDDAVLASTYGLRNLQRIVPNLVQWTAEDGRTYEDLQELYGQVTAQWNRYMNHVARSVGGVYSDYKTYDQAGPVYTPVPADKQRAALDFLQEQAFTRPDWLLDPELLRRFEGAGAMERVRQLQTGVLNRLLNPGRLARLLEAEAVDAVAPTGVEVYAASDFLADLRDGLWSELDQGAAIDPMRRTLQRGYVEQLGSLMTNEPTSPPAAFASIFGFTPVRVSQSDIRPLVRGELQLLQSEIRQALRRAPYRRTVNRATRLHLEDALIRIEDILDPTED